MNYNFDVEVAREYGVNEAIMITNFQFWIKKNKSNNENFFDNHYWTYNSHKAFIKLFPFWSEQTIKTILKHLKERGVLITGNYNENKYDQTLWYAFADEERWLEESVCSHKLVLTNGEVKTNQPIPNINPNKKKITKKGEEEPLKEAFLAFWKEYPKQRAGSKEKAFKSYCRAIKEKRATEEKILQSCLKYAKSDEVKRGFAKGCAAWLNDDRFNTEYVVKEKQFEW